jgi:hypothetical protein
LEILKKDLVIRKLSKVIVKQENVITDIKMKLLAVADTMPEKYAIMLYLISETEDPIEPL